MSSKLLKLADSLGLLAARMRADAANGVCALSAGTTTSVLEVLAMRESIAARLRAGDGQSEDLIRLDKSLAELAEAFAAMQARADTAPLPRQERLRALRFDASTRRLLNRATIALGLSAGGLAIVGTTIGANAGTCTSSGQTMDCSGNFSLGQSFSIAASGVVQTWTVIVHSLTGNVTPASGNPGFSFTSAGTEGTHHGAASSGEGGGPGQNLTLQSLDTNSQITTTGDNAFGVAAQSTGGGAGNGGGGIVCPIPCESGGDGGMGGQGGKVVITNLTKITTGGDNAAGVYALSHGGLGGSGGDSNGGSGAGSGGAGGNAGTVTLTNDGVISTAGFQANGVYAASIGGNGGSGGGGFAWAGGAAGGGANSGNTVLITNNKDGAITTTGDNAIGIYAESIGGFGGGGGGSAGLFGFGGDGSLGGNAGSVTVFNFATVATGGDNSYAIFAQSVGGGGGNGGSGAGIVSLGGGGSAGGSGSNVDVENHGDLQTSGVAAHGIFAESVGGGGGNGGDAGGLSAMGGTGSSTSPSGFVVVNNSGDILTTGDRAFGILAQSIGGGGGDGGSAGGLHTIGGGGGDGGDGGVVIVNNSGSIETEGDDAAALFAQSVGGGGGNGGSSSSVALFSSVAIGGDGAAGGAGMDVSVNANNTRLSPDANIITLGDRSDGILAQSVGGGGGNGGFAFAGSIGAGFSSSLAVGGTGGKGGGAGDVIAETNGSITTLGASSDGIVAQSVGGGGGNGGFAIAISGSDGAALALTVGGKGGVAGDAQTATVSSWATIETAGDDAIGGLAESIGGGGGNGGFAVSVAAGGVLGGSLAWGGKGGAGGAGSSATLTSIGDVTTLGMFSHGLVAESIGGGGGNGGFAVAGAFTTGVAGIALGFGGGGAGGGDAGAATLTSTGNIETFGFGANGLISESIGGGGGAGGFAGALGASAGGGAISLSLGGDGSEGGDGKAVLLTSTGNVVTHGDEATAIFAQSLGGGGGNGGFSLSFAASTQDSLSVALGGGAGQGGTSDMVTLTSTGDVLTSGVDSIGIMAQSVGGSGGNGGFAASGSLSTGALAATVAIGGSGGTGASSGVVLLTSTGDVITQGAGAIGILGQSVGGGGGNGGLSGALSLGNGNAYAKSVGGDGGSGNFALTATVISTGNVMTAGDNATGIEAQSVGGGGGNGGMAITVAASVKSNAVGKDDAGAGGMGGTADAASVTSNGMVYTTGNLADGIISQSIGGGGGNGGIAIGGAFSGQGDANINSVGGNGGSGNNAGSATVISDATADSVIAGFSVMTMGTGSDGIFAQSVGGGGGNGGFSISGAFSVDGTATNNTVGGSGGAAGDALWVSVTNTGNISTAGMDADGIYAQSVGGGGGNGGFAIGAAASAKMDANSTVGGGTGGAAGIANLVTVINTGSIWTLGDDADGIFAQSVGGGGGNGGFAIGASFSSEGSSTSSAVGGNGGSGGSADIVTVTQTGNITTVGMDADGILAQSVGGGGGNGGFSIGAAFDAKGDASSTVGGASAAAGGVGSDGKAVNVTASGTIITTGASADAIFAQSVGGGGGNGGFSIGGAFSSTGGASSNTVGGGGGAAGNSDAVLVIASGTLMTQGDSAIGILAQSVGGGGGNGGFAIGAGLSVKGDSSSTVGGGGSGTGGNSGTVTVQDTADIETSGADAAGILAQSVGGGGGNGGFAVSGAFSNEGGATSNATGGNGGLGGTAQTVMVTVSGVVMTSGLNSNGVTAQSIGGGGGNGGFAVGAGFSAKGDASSTVGGGAGGTAGGGGIVGVSNTNFISTSGMNALGILAQSVGGGGGDGGFAASGSFSLDGGATSSSVGGQGAGGGDAMAVTVSNSGIISTSGANATAILAQSVGGGGGVGGFSLGLGASKSDAVTSTVGGAGGSGGIGAAVTVTNETGGMIFTTGDLAYGIEAQSIGGGGGAGGFSVGGALSLQGNASSTVGGGVGAGGGAAGLVTVSNFDQIDTSGMSAIGILAQSIGGGGGSGGFAGGLAAGNSGADSNNVGGAGGLASTGGDVIVDNEGAIFASGVNSIGILAQSVGGGGGNGGFSLSAGGATQGDAASSSVGGAGGGGGAGGTVQVINGLNASIITSADFSYGVQAQSIGGGGGNGGFALGGGFSSNGNASSSVGGGAASGGGAAGAVTVSNAGLIVTQGAQSIGVFAQSVGGGGGSGGFSGSLSVSNNGSTSNSVGGAGAGGGSADMVTVTNNGDIHTEGANSMGVLAQSIGGGGGNGGFSLSASGSSGDGTTSSIGGSGAGGGDGGKVMVTNNGTILTDSALSYGVYAQSVGGGGGNGGFSVAGTLADGGGMTGSVGGSGLGGGAGGDVTVVNTGSIIVSGASSVGVFAQSVGGGGGSGGFSGAVRFDSGGDLDSTVGASGGAGGSGGNVTVTSTGSIVTLQDDSVGVLAQSIGGGGGESAFAISAMAGQLSSADLALGAGSTGTGGVMGTVIVNVSGGTIQTEGALSYGLLAQSIGAGGGNAALSVPDPLTVGAGGVTLTVGASGSIGGDSNTLVTTNSNPMSTSGAGSVGLIAQSIGGGGGMEGDTGDLDIGNGIITDSVGGTSAMGGSGKAVTFSNSGAVVTFGDDALGILAQSIGGGGGDGFFAVGVVTGTAQEIDLTTGGAQGETGNGAAITIPTLTGNVWTSGRMANGVTLQSIGGGGGVASFVAPFGIAVGTGGINLADGATGGNGGNGAAISFTSGATINTSGVGAAGLLVQSIGGGGGLVSFDSDGAQNPSITGASLGGAAGGNGGSLTFTVAGSVTTGGSNAVGVLAQSIGAGGGFIDAAGATLNAPLSLGGSASGNGDAVNIMQNAAISTSGNGAHGLVAQSIGGGGGLFLAANEAGGAESVTTNAGSGGGNGGAVVVTTHAAIATSGADAYGLIAQSIGGGGGLAGAGDYNTALGASGSFAGTVGGAGTGGMVWVTVNGDITASGAHANAIFAQSAGGTGNGTVSVDIENGTVWAGGTSASVRIADGANNSLTNRGTITTALGVTGEAVQTGSAADTFDNFNLLTGSVDMGAGINVLTNHVGAVFNAGPVIALGASNSLNNSGKLSVGGDNALAVTALTGNLVQTATGNDFVDLDIKRTGQAMSTDRLNVSGTANLAGIVTANILNPGYLTPGHNTGIALTASGGVQHANLSLVAPASAVVSFALEYPDADTVVLSNTVNFAPVGLTPNETALGNTINAIQAGGGPDSFRPVIVALYNIPAVPALAKAYETILPAAQATGIVSTEFSSQLFTDQLFSCAAPGGLYSVSDDESCAWARIDGRRFTQTTTALTLGLHENDFAFSGGAEHALSQGWRIGGALSYEVSDQRQSPLSNSSGDRFQGGVVLKKESGDMEYAAAVTGGAGWFDSQRFIPLVSTFAQGTQDFTFGSASLRAGERFIFDLGYIRPNIELLGSLVNMHAFHESGAGPLDLFAAAQQYGTVRIKPGVEFGSSIAFGDDLWLRPSIKFDLSQSLAGNTTTLYTGFDGAPSGIAPLGTSTRGDSLLEEVTAGADLINNQGLSVKFNYFAKFGSVSHQQGFDIKATLPF